MNVFKAYSSKANATRAAKKVGQEAIQQDGQWGIMVPQQVTLEQAQAEAALDNAVEGEVATTDAHWADLRAGGRGLRCPHCNVGLDNGISVHSPDSLHETNEFSCLGCGEEFGPAIAPKAAPLANIISDLPLEQHGVKRPQRAGLCWEVWELAFSLQEATGALPTVAAMREAAPHLNPTNVQIEYYNWRKYNGVRGRQAKA